MRWNGVMNNKMCARPVVIIAAVLAALLPAAVPQDFDGRKEVGFYFYSRRGPKEGVKVEVGDKDKLLTAKYDPTFFTKLVTHGFVASYQDQQVQLIKDAYVYSGDNNVIAVDWQHLASDWNQAIANNRNIGRYIGTFILFLVEELGAKLEDVHVIGHSLGGELVGFVGDVITDPKVGRITGLDPAQQDYTNVSTHDRLDKEDANLVDVFHTSTTGLQIPMGHVDYFPNGGVGQTGCNGDSNCDHATSWKYFAHSILQLSDYLAAKCSSLEDAQAGTCDGELHLMGDALLNTTSGIFYQKVLNPIG